MCVCVCPYTAYSLAHVERELSSVWLLILLVAALVSLLLIFSSSELWSEEDSWQVGKRRRRKAMILRQLTCEEVHVREEGAERDE